MKLAFISKVGKADFESFKKEIVARCDSLHEKVLDAEVKNLNLREMVTELNKEITKLTEEITVLTTENEKIAKKLAKKEAKPLPSKTVSDLTTAKNDETVTYNQVMNEWLNGEEKA